MRTRLLRSAAFLGAALAMLVAVAWPGPAARSGGLYALAFALFLLGALTFIERSRGWRHPGNLVVFAFLTIFAVAVVAHVVWRAGTVVAEASFNPGIAPFDVTVREVPVPVTGSRHFIVTLRRGQYPVTSFRYFWVNYTPKNVKIEWTKLETFKVIFDDRYVATCNWSWGKEATWTMQVPPGGEAPGDRP
ncbi:MAG TPA: hypothetical protein VKE95_05480 [Burkholderiales bacterium]|nr:hypothetical protein [Burkholderiales bacterium]